MIPDIFSELALLLLLTAGVSMAAVFLRQPLIVGYIAAGILVGPSVLNIVSENDQIDLLAKLGITLLLFVVGLKLDLHIIRTIGPVALATGLGQVFFTSVIGYAIAIALGMTPMAALYVAVALTFSSTIIIVKLLSDKREIDTLHGRIALGFLIVQDLVVVFVMIGLNALGQAGETAIATTLLWTLAKAMLFLLAVALITKYFLQRNIRLFSRSQEFLVLFGIAWAVTLATLGEALGFSKEVGAFVAGVCLASTPYRDALGARLVSLRDFLLLFFFIDLGARLNLGLLGAQLTESLVFSLFVLIGNPVIVLIIMGVLGYRRRTGFLAGLTVAQISEFSLILGALGLSLGHIDAETMGLITLVGLITISASTYMILFSQPLYERLAPWLQIFERANPQAEGEHSSDMGGYGAEILMFGAGRYGSHIADALRGQGNRVLCIDYNPDLVRPGTPLDYPVIYGDVEDPEFVATLPIVNARWVVSSIRHLPINKVIINTLKHLGYSGRIAVTARSPDEAEILKQTGADLVLVPDADAALEAAKRLLGEEES